ncbi:MAG: PAS domain S-box protein, partial [Pseudomonadota bacterium]
MPESAFGATGGPLGADRVAEDFRTELSRKFIGAVMVLGAAGAILFGGAAVVAPLWPRVLVSAGCAALALLAAWLQRGPVRAPLAKRSAVLVAASGVICVATLSAIALDLGVHSMGLTVLTLLACLMPVLVGVRRAVWLVVVCAVAVVALALSERAGWITGLPDPTGYLMLLRTVTHLLMLAAGCAAGLILARAVTRAGARARSREQRFAGLLAVAADWYWEMDASFRFTHLSEHAAGSGLRATRRIGKAPWEIENFGLDALAMDAHRADLESHQPFVDLLLQRAGPGGRPHWYTVSGRPRFDGRGMFLGYWGVGRDVTTERQAELARVATEARYRELFARSPSPLVLHRATRVLDANDAALALFGVPDVAAVIGRDLLEFYDESDGSRQKAAERARALEGQEVGESTPPHQFILRNLRGRRIVAQATSVKIDTGDGAAILSIYHDQTEHLRAEAARMRSEALMTHLVATSPDVIALTDLATGRYVMVNDAFSRVTGWSRGEVLGKTALDLGLYAGIEERQRLLQKVAQQGAARDHQIACIDRHGRAFSLLVSVVRFELEGRDYLVLNGRDVTDQERERLEREAILLNASIGIALTRDQTFHLANPCFEQMFGWPDGTLIGQPGACVWPSVEDYQAMGREVGPVLARGEPIEVERVVARRDGSTFLCRLLGRAVDPNHPSKGATIWIAEDVTERRQVEQALARARDDAEAANRAKSAFLANTSHEI